MRVTRDEILQLVTKLDETIDIVAEAEEPEAGDMGDLCSIAESASTLLSKLAAEKTAEHNDDLDRLEIYKQLIRELTELLTGLLSALHQDMSEFPHIADLIAQCEHKIENVKDVVS